MFLLKTPLPVDDGVGITLIDRWTTNLHHLQRVYIFHGYDEEADVGDSLWLGSNKLYRRAAKEEMAYAPFSRWYSIDIRPMDFERGLEPSQNRGWIPILKEDRDEYDTDKCDIE